jgi:uncharacterized membrane protein YsdA (DUF1294 family)
MLPLRHKTQAMVYLLLAAAMLNLYAYYLMASDKQKARQQRYRTPERTLLLLAVLGGSWGILGGMLPPIHHKNRKWYFWLTVFAGIALQAVGVVLYLSK